MTEPMTDAPHRPIDVQSILDRLRIIEGGTVETVTLRPAEARAILDHIGACAEHCAAMEARVADEGNRADAAESARDAALARADEAEAETDRWFTRALAAIWKLPEDMRVGDLQDAHREIEKLRARALPEPVLMETVEQVKALPRGHYLVRLAEGRPYTRAFERDGFYPTWLETGSAAVLLDREFVGALISGPLPVLPDLPTPTAGETP